MESILIKPGVSFIIPIADSFSELKPLEMIWLPAGSFIMGSRSDELGFQPEFEKQFTATISRGFWIGKYPVTQRHWLAFRPENPSEFIENGSDRPVENVSWVEAQLFYNLVNERFGNYIPKGYVFGLPTEMQWEYTCRAGTHTQYNVGDTEADLNTVAWHAGNSNGTTQPVGMKQSNAWGLFDMHGNVSEWCYDSPSEYPKGSAGDWVGTGDGSVRVVRGAGWGTPLYDGEFRSACRCWVPAQGRRSWLGFRLCLRWEI